MAQSIPSLPWMTTLSPTTGGGPLVVDTGSGGEACTRARGNRIRSDDEDVTPPTETTVIQSQEYLKISIDEKNQTASRATIPSPTMRAICDDMTAAAVRCDHIGYRDG